MERETLIGIAIFVLVLVVVIVLFITFGSERKRYTWQPQGDANFYRIMDDGKWFSIVQFNGEIHHVAQEEYMDGIVQALNEDCT